MLKLFIIGAVLELLMVTSLFWRYRFWILLVSIFLTAFSSGMILVDNFNLIMIVLFIASLFRLTSLIRVTEQRLHESYLRRVVLRTSISLISSQIILYAVWFVGDKYFSGEVANNITTDMASMVQLIFAMALLLVTRKSLKSTSFKPIRGHYTDKDLPTVTVAIPARNETVDLSACLAAVVASDYPKLEVIVLDDCSQDKTSDIIKGFARDGVRFIHGSEPQDNWLAKNQAYEQLSEAATGQYIVFLSVDTHISTSTIRTIITSALDNKKTMICILPRQRFNGFLASAIQPMRNWWEFALPRRFTNRPAISSSCWMITRKALAKAGDFEAVSRAVLPEAYFARKEILTDSYSFLRSNGNIEVSSIKDFNDQFDRAMRVRYPEVHKKIELVMLLSMAEVLFLLAPVVLFLLALLTLSPILLITTTSTMGLLLYTHHLILKASNPDYKLISMFNFPIMVITEIGLGIYSMIRYEFSEVDWKGRNICLPVMHVTPYIKPVNSPVK
ncbi:MAG: glycosyltransferase [Candidatus Saccharibacteria bacterium]